MQEEFVRPEKPKWATLLQEAVNTPGLVNPCYNRFHDYSISNTVWAIWQCMGRGIAPGPIAPYSRWQAMGRQVRKGEKALSMLMPVTIHKGKGKGADRADADKADKEDWLTVFVVKNRWFVLAQTDGLDLPPAPLPDWDRAKAADALGLTQVAYDSIDGNSQGYCKGKAFAINPLAVAPHKTAFHEMGHCLLHGGEETDGETQSQKEMEAEAVAMLCLDSLGIVEGQEYARGYIQSWWGAGNPIPDEAARKIFRAADQIVKAGKPEAKSEAE